MSDLTPSGPGGNHRKFQAVQGKVCLITGASSGLGFATARRWVSLGATVVMVCRDAKKGRAAYSRILAEVPKASLKLMVADLASWRSIRELIDAFRQQHSALDVLLNCAAVLEMEPTTTEDGLPTMIQTNHLAPAFLSLSFVDLLSRPDARIINIAIPPEEMRLTLDALDPLRPIGGLDAFFRTKAYLFFYSLALSRRLVERKIPILLTDPAPGPFRSGLGRQAPWTTRLVYNLLAAPVARAVENLTFLAFASSISSDKVFSGRTPRPLIPYWQNVEVSEQVWSLTKQMMPQ